MNTSPPNLPKFLADRYRDSRPLYPPAIFRVLLSALGDVAPTFLDLGCGAGQSTFSYLSLGRSSSGFAIDPDPEMIAAARTLLREFPAVELKIGQAEALPLPDRSVDLVFIGSAVHWFDLGRAQTEIERVLRGNGLLFAFEYQFPKCTDDSGLAEVIRRRFNLEWKAPVQKPRGTLADLMTPFRESSRWSFVAEDRPVWTESLSLDPFLGHLFSQSRYLHAEASAEDPAAYREAVAEFFRPFFKGRDHQFDLKPRALAFRMN